MGLLNDLLYRLRTLTRRNQAEAELRDELEFHLAKQTEKNLRLGMEPAEAERRARIELGGVDQVKEECRQARGVSAIESAVQDLRYATRGMFRSPVFTATAVLSLALSTGAISTVFTLANTFFYRPLPVNSPDEVVFVHATRRQGRVLGSLSYPDYVHFRDGSRTLKGLAAHYSTAPLFVTTAKQAVEINGAVVSASFFPLLGVKPVVGRFFGPEEDSVPDRDPVAVLSHDLWHNWFGGSAQVVGTTLKINGTTFTVIGVAPETFHGVSHIPAEIYIPTMMLRTGYRWCEDSLGDDCTILGMVGRLAEEQTVEQAIAELRTLIPAGWVDAAEGENTGITVVPAKGAPRLPRGASIQLIQLLAWIAGVLLLVCCANLSGLLIARNSARTRELAIRTSLGAGRVRLIRQLTTESVLLGGCGGVLGLALSMALTNALNSMFYSVDAEGHPLYFSFTMEPSVIVGVVAVSIMAGMLAGILPAIRSIGNATGENLKRQSISVTSESRLTAWLLGVQTAIAVALVAVAALLATNAHSLLSGENFEVSRVALMRLRPRLVGYSPEEAQRFLRTVISRLDVLPGVESVSMVGTGVVLVGGGADVSLPGSLGLPAVESGYIEIGPRYFETLRTPILRGREFDVRDDIRSPAVAVVNDTLARRLWPTEEVIGSILMVNERPHQVVGIVGDVPLQSGDQPAMPYVYTPYWQNPMQIDARLCVRVAGDPESMLPSLVREVHQVDAVVPIAETITLRLQLAGLLKPLRMTASFVSYGGSLAVFLCAIGVYAAMSFSVSRRTREIGIRKALGAHSSGVLRMVVRDGMAITLVGAVAGIGLAVAGTKAVRHLLHGPGTGYLGMYMGGALMVAIVGLLASWLPARRAASVEPITALRED